MEAALTALLIFSLRICDVSIGTVRVIYTIQGHRILAPLLGAVESGIWIFAISRAFKYVDDPISMVAWALGFAAGTALGISVERWIASGAILVRVICRSERREPIRAALLEQGFGVTALRGEGREGEVDVIFTVASRKRGEEMLALLRGIDPDAFVTVDAVTMAMGGFVPRIAPAASLRK